jgi:hypothetical protein
MTLGLQLAEFAEAIRGDPHSFFGSHARKIRPAREWL